MNDNILAELSADLKTIKNILVSLLESNQALVQYNAPTSPNYRYPLADYANFNWHSIGANVVASDSTGATHVNWGGYTWKRRNDASKKRGQAIWFSRPLPESENADYARLVTFADLAEVEPMAFAVATAVKPTTTAVKPSPLPRNIGKMTLTELDVAMLVDFPELKNLEQVANLRQQVTENWVQPKKADGRLDTSLNTAVFNAVKAYVESRRNDETGVGAQSGHKRAKITALAYFCAERENMAGKNKP